VPVAPLRALASRRAAAALGFLIAAVAPWAQAVLPREVAASLAAANIPASQVSVWVQDLGLPQPELRHNAEEPRNPASTIKLVTTYAALEMLGPTFTWKTEAWTSAPLVGDVLQGDLVLRGGGDPKLTFEQFWLLLRGLRARGVREIRGDLVLDRSWLDGSQHDPGRFDGQPTQPYNVGPDALLLNFKAFRFAFVPDPSRKTIAVFGEPPSSSLELASNVRYGEGPCGDWRAGIKADFQPVAPGTRVTFSGTYPASCGEQMWNVALLPHPEYVHGVFRKLWEELGGTLAGRWRDGTVPPGARLLHRHESPPLTEAVRDINKFSNNVMARQLFLDLSADGGAQPGRPARSAENVRGWAAAKGLRMPELVLENGSGLSREERISADSMGQMLAAAYRSAVMPEFISSLPLVAYDGTMRRRLRFESVAGQAHIKTGSLTGVRAIAGYLLDRQGRRHVLVFFINHPNAAAGQPAMDALLRWVYEGGCEAGQEKATGTARGPRACRD
jgi:D-alanyl-D-alanine carboxypeptidase/D-alanyl-D-alanine-endopeptidase (penicillin-binding protein 4)